MNADTPRITENAARARHLNSVHGVYLNDAYSVMGRELLPVASLNSMTLLHAEMVGRAYGGGILKIEPKEADTWAVPSPTLVAACADGLREVKRSVAKLLDKGRLLGSGAVSATQMAAVRRARAELANRRNLTAASGR